MLRKVYIRYREDVPDNANCYAALDGFRKLGVETAPFYGFGDVKALSDLGPEVGLHGFVGDVHAALDVMGKPRPPALDYPAVLYPLLGRRVWRGKLADAWRHPGRVFVKPVQQKLFTGFLMSGSVADARRAAFDPETPVWLSDPVEFVAEYRCFVLSDWIVDVRLYKGDWCRTLDRVTVNEAVVRLSPAAPRAYAIDFGVVKNGGTCLVEVNDAFALGHYGIDNITYAKMIAARWEEMTLDVVTDPVDSCFDCGNEIAAGDYHSCQVAQNRQDDET